MYPQADHGFSDTRRHDSEINTESYAIAQPQVLTFIKATTS